MSKQEKAIAWAKLELSITKLKALAYQQTDIQAVKDELKELQQLVEELSGWNMGIV